MISSFIPYSSSFPEIPLLPRNCKSYESRRTLPLLKLICEFGFLNLASIQNRQSEIQNRRVGRRGK